MGVVPDTDIYHFMEEADESTVEIGAMRKPICFYQTRRNGGESECQKAP